ncbi:MAG TPA: hypothetical protein VN706_11715 [Gemmatimonadaceae bacterium]|nr:hypothetical protein [Gemmatimonadaceae bacterium]
MRRSLFRVLAFASVAVLPVSVRAQIVVLSNTVEERIAAPGERYTSTIIIVNPSTEPQTARIYQTDYQFAADGTGQFNDPGTTLRSNAGWVTPQTTQIVVPANGRVAVPYTVVVPKTDSLKGTYWSAIMVEGQTAQPGKSGAKPTVELGSVMRYAIQVATHIQMSGTRAVKFVDPGVVKTTDGTATFDVDVLDNGDRGYRPTLWVEIYDANGVLQAKAKQTRGLLYPGSSIRQHFVLGKLTPGTYKAMLFADTGDEAVIAAQYDVKY